MIIMIDNGHGIDTQGKRSPDGKLKEWDYTRIVALCVFRELNKLGYSVTLITPETTDVPLATRVKRINERYHEHQGEGILISIHLNAAGDGKDWMKARGWECWTSKGDTESDKLAEELYAAAREALPANIPLRTDPSDGDSDKEAGFYILKHSKCPAVLTENLFMDSEDDCEYLLSDEGLESIVKLHVQGIVNYLTNKK